VKYNKLTLDELLLIYFVTFNGVFELEMEVDRREKFLSRKKKKAIKLLENRD